MGSRLGVMKIAAKRIGVSLEEYQAKIDAGEKWCHSCRQWKARAAFNIDRSRGDGLTAKCRDCTTVDDPYASLRGRVSTFKGKTHTEEAKQKMSKARKGTKNRLGKKHTEETRKKISELTRERTPRGKDHYNYSHGKAQRNLNDRRKPEYLDWRNAVFERDNYTCQKCADSQGGHLRAHHIKPFKDHLELRFDVDNGVSLCHTCHELEHFKPDSIRNQRKLKKGEKLWK